MSAREAAPKAAPKEGLPTLHHLSDSQSQAMIWLLEELNVEYNLVLYQRDKGHRAPPELRNINQLGKSPVFVTTDGRPIIERSAISAYILKTYDTTGKHAAEDWVKDEILNSFAGATLGPLTAIELLFDLATKHTPWPLVYIARGFRKGVQKTFTTAEFKQSLEFLERELGDNEWFNGKEFGRADVMMNFPIDYIYMRKWVDNPELHYPKVTAWRQRVWERPAWKRGIEKGNGYDLAMF
ncbi:glutathione S-transferase [Hyaloscypha variabilis]